MKRSVLPIIKRLSVILGVFSVTWLIPITVAYWFKEPHHPFLHAALLNLGLGIFLYAISAHTTEHLRRNDGFIIVALSWVLLSLCTAVPFWHSQVDMPWIDGLFEAVSGFTTTGAEVIDDLAAWPQSLLFYHQWLQFLGGLGIIILGMALIPMLQASGSQWQLSEISSAGTDKRITPMLRQTARALWLIYAGATLLCSLAYHIAGMPWFEALCYSFSTVSTGGFGIHTDNLGHYNMPAISCVAMAFMLFSSINFTLHYRALHYRSLKAYLSSQELRLYLLLLCLVIAILSVALMPDGVASWHHILFTATAMLSTTGLQVSTFATWPDALPSLLMVCAMVGGCCGSTSGGLKVARLAIFFQEARCALFSLAHPNAITHPHLEGERLSSYQLQAIRGFIAVFVITYVGLILGFMQTGYDLHTAFAAISACLSNVGLTIAPLAKGYSQLNIEAKGLLIFTMIAGRLEILTLFILFTPSFWTDKAMT